jgi:SAM-dependent methyltransferase
VLRVLDAGAGHGADFGGNAYVTAVDISAEALALNDRADEKIVGDITVIGLPPETFDLVHCNDVLEHVPDPLAAITNLAGALAPGGKMEIGFPDVMSRKSLIAKATPHWLHVWIYRRVFRFANAGEPGHGPYPTHLSWALRPKPLRRHVERLGLTVERFEREPGAAFRSRPLLALLAGRTTEYTLVLRKPY